MMLDGNAMNKIIIMCLVANRAFHLDSNKCQNAENSLKAYLKPQIYLNREGTVALLFYLERGLGDSPDVVLEGLVKGEDSLLQEVLYLAIVGVLHPDLPVVGVGPATRKLNEASDDATVKC